MFTQLVRVLHNNNLKNGISIMLSVYEKYELCISGFLKITFKLLKKMYPPEVHNAIFPNSQACGLS